MYLPDKVFIKPQAKFDPATKEIIRRIQSFDPNIPIVYLKGKQISYPKLTSAVWRWQQKKKNLILAHRTVPFLTTFASPGNIVERMGVILNLGWQCPSNCQFCYLQSVLPQEHIIYTNIEDLNRQLTIEPFVHRSVLSLWSIISFIRKEELRKVPSNFHRAANYIRKKFIKEGVSNKNEAVELLEGILHKKESPVFKILKRKTPDIGYKAKDLIVDHKTLLRYYNRNSKYFPRISVAEFTDIVAFDHLCGHSNVIMEQIARVPEIEFTVRTKSAYVDELVKHDGDDRVTIAINFNTPYVIEHYEQGTASLDDRILAAQKVQGAHGIRLGVVIEPVIKYPGYEKDYVELARKIIKSLDPNRISDVAVSSVRYSGRLESRVKRNFPATDLFDDKQGLLPVVKNDRRRYPLEERDHIYQLIFNEFRQHTNAYLRLGAETPDVWKSLGLDTAALMKKSVYQYGRTYPVLKKIKLPVISSSNHPGADVMEIQNDDSENIKNAKTVIECHDKILSTYFSGVVNSPVECPFDQECGLTCTFDRDGMFECSSCGKSGFFADEYVKLIEGISKDNIDKHIKELLSDKIPNKIEFEQWNKNLLDDKNLQAFEYLQNERGISKQTINDLKIGLNNGNELVIPIPNSTGYGYVGACFIGVSGGSVRLVGGVVVWGYHNLKKSKEGSTIICVGDVLDSILLQQNGICAVGFPLHSTSWPQELLEHFNKKNIVICFSDSQEENSLSEAILHDVVENANSVKKIVYSSGLLPTRLANLSEYFVKHEKSIIDFEALIKSFHAVPKNTKHILGELQNERLTNFKTRQVRPAQDYIDGTLYYAISINKKPYLIDSSGAANKLDDLKLKGIELVINEFPVSKFSSAGISDYIQRAKRANASSVFESIRDHLQKYVFLKDKDIYSVLTLWTMGTYVFRAFRHYPYLHVSAEKGSGKSTLMEIMSRLAFNGKTGVGASEAALFRDIDLNLSSLFLDEMEKAKTGTLKTLIEILNSGYSNTGSTSRVVKNKTKNYSTYSPKMFAGINDINETLTDRSIKIRILKGQSKESKKFIHSKKIFGYETSTRDDLYIFGLNEIGSIATKYENDMLPYLSNLQNREHDRWAPLFIIADIIDSTRNDGMQTVIDSCMRYLNEDKYIHEVANIDSTMVQLLEGINDLIKRERPVKKDGELYQFANDSVFKFFKKRNDFKFLKTNSELTKLLSTVGVKKPTTANVSGNSQRCYWINYAEIKDIGVRYGVWTDSVNTELVVDDSHDKLFIPKRIIVTPNAKQFPLTERIISEAKKLNPTVEISYSIDGNHRLPGELLDGSQIHQYLRETMLLCERSDEFMVTFPSPGDIVEEMNTMCRVATRCSCNCEFCYLQIAGKGGTTIQWRRYFVDVQRIKDEIEKEHLVHTTNLTLWSALSFYLKKPLEKVYESGKDGLKDFVKIADEIRKEILKTDSRITKDADAKAYLENGLANRFMEMGLDLSDVKRFETVKGLIHKFYNENKKMDLWLNIGEYTDLLSIDHLCGYIDHLMELLREDNRIHYSLYTKSANVDNLLMHDAKKRVRITMNLNTEYVIKEYEHDTASLSKRFEAVNKILATKKFLLDLSIEPFIVYEDYEADYRALMERIKDEIDISDPNLRTIKFGGVRYRRKLAEQILKNHPLTNLFDNSENLVDPTGTDDRMRYPIELRVKMYKMFIDIFKGNRDKLMLGCEFSDVWEKVGLDWVGYVSKFVFQYNDQTKNMY